MNLSFFAHFSLLAENYNRTQFLFSFPFQSEIVEELVADGKKFSTIFLSFYTLTFIVVFVIVVNAKSCRTTTAIAQNNYLFRSVIRILSLSQIYQ